MKADVLRDARCMMAEGRCVISLFHSHLVSYIYAPRLLSGARLLSFFSPIFEHESHGLNGLLYTPIPQKALKGAITDGDISGSPEGEKFLRPSSSKRQSRAVQNLIQNCTKYMEPSQMAGM